MPYVTHRRASARRIASAALQWALAFALTVTSAALIQRDDLEVGIYGNMGTLRENVRPRLVGGWPAPFLADREGTSVPFDLGAEDEFRPGSFVASLAFWFLLVSGLRRIVLSARRMRRRSAA